MLGTQQFQKSIAIFFINNGKAKSKDIEELMRKVQKRVQEKTGVSLELEIKIVGE